MHCMYVRMYACMYACELVLLELQEHGASKSLPNQVLMYDSFSHQ